MPADLCLLYAVHSPVQLDPELKAELDAIGQLKHVVTPNC